MPDAQVLEFQGYPLPADYAGTGDYGDQARGFSKRGALPGGPSSGGIAGLAATSRKQDYTSVDPKYYIREFNF